MDHTDILVIGSGIGGLFFAITTAQKRPDLSITIMAKSCKHNTNTSYAQGGIAVVTGEVYDSYEQHVLDTIKAGGGACDEEIVDIVVKQAPKRLKELIELGISFDTNASGKWELGLEGGHTHHRILHHKDTSGKEIEDKLLQKVAELGNIKLLENHIVIDLNVQLNKCTGALYYDKAEDSIKYIAAKCVVLCTGGCGQLFTGTTNPNIATGDGVAIAFRAGAVIEDMQYIQFHPTALYEENKNPFFLVSEALRGYGAHIINKNANRFLFKYDARGELATRDIVSRVIASEMQLDNQKHVFMDCRHLDCEDLQKHFPSITKYCNSIGIDLSSDLIPVFPVAHYQCGGIKVDKNGKTNIINLYAVGECSRTGLHGKNRLASNSLLEALVFAYQSSKNICAVIDEISFCYTVYPFKYDNSVNSVDLKLIETLKTDLRNAITTIYHSSTDNIPALQKLQWLKTISKTSLRQLKISVPLLELSNMITVALLIESQLRSNRASQNTYNASVSPISKKSEGIP